MKILIISTLYPPYAIGGAEKAAALLAEALAQRDHEVVVVSLHEQSNESVEILNGVRVYRLPLDNFYWPFGRKSKPAWFLRLAWHIRDIWNVKAARRIARILDIESPDVVHTHNISGFSTSIWQQVKQRKIRLVHTLHDYYLLCPRGTLYRNGEVCKKRCMSCAALTYGRKSSSQMPDAVVAVSQYTLNEHLKHGYFNNIRSAVIFNILNADATEAHRTSDSERMRFELVFGFIGRIEKEKGIETLLQATSMLQKTNWKLVIAGSGLNGYVEGLKSKFNDSRILWLGFTNNASFYASIDTVIIPSEWPEPLSYVCIEAIHKDKPLICANSGGISEIARLDGNVEFFSAGDANALAGIMDVALAAPQKWRTPAGGDSSELDVFREKNVVDKYLREYLFKHHAAHEASRGGKVNSMNAIPRILILGAAGQLGAELQRSFAGFENVVAVDRNTVDIADPGQLRDFVRGANPNIILNAAAYTAVDRAETEPEIAMAINGRAPRVLAEEALRLNTLLVHYSTDYVFDGTKTEPWTELDSPNPLNAYGVSKLAGERAIQEIGGKYLIFRTSWVYGPHGSNFMLSMLRLGRERDRISVVNDQYGSPTTSIELARASHRIIDGVSSGRFGEEKDWAGLYHMTCSGSTSWYNFAQNIFTKGKHLTSGKTPAVMPIAAQDYPTLARRPINSVLSNELLYLRFGVQLAPWETALDDVLRILS